MCELSDSQIERLNAMRDELRAVTAMRPAAPTPPGPPLLSDIRLAPLDDKLIRVPAPATGTADPLLRLAAIETNVSTLVCRIDHLEQCLRRLEAVSGRRPSDESAP